MANKSSDIKIKQIKNVIKKMQNIINEHNEIQINIV